MGSMKKTKIFFVASKYGDEMLLGRKVREYQERELSGLECRFFDDFQEAESAFCADDFNVVLPLACPLVTLTDVERITKNMTLRAITAVKFHSSSAYIVRGKRLENPIFVNNSAFFEINDAKSFSMVYNILKDRIASRHLSDGVVLLGKDTIFIDDTVEIGAGAKILPFCRIEGRSQIESGATLISSFVRDSIVRAGACVDCSHVVDSSVGEDATVGPYARLRGANVGKGCRIGDFVEVKASSIGDGSKSAHLTYIGDATVGERTNIGCGTVFCNYDGKLKHKTTVGSDCFVGANVNLVAPVNVGDGSFVAAGTTVTHDLNVGEFAIGRADTKISKNKNI